MWRKAHSTIDGFVEGAAAAVDGSYDPEAVERVRQSLKRKYSQVLKMLKGDNIKIGYVGIAKSSDFGKICCNIG